MAYGYRKYRSGGRGYRKRAGARGPMRRKFYKRTGRRMNRGTLLSMIKRVARSTQEPKRKSYIPSQVNMQHDELWVINPLAALNISKGAEANQRIGEKIFVKGIRVVFNFALDINQIHDVRLRIMAFRGQYFALTASDWGNQVTAIKDLFFGSATRQGAEIVDTDFVSILKQTNKVIRNTPYVIGYSETNNAVGTNNVGVTTSYAQKKVGRVSVWLPINKTITYRATDSSISFKGLVPHFGVYCWNMSLGLSQPTAMWTNMIVHYRDG